MVKETNAAAAAANNNMEEEKEEENEPGPIVKQGIIAVDSHATSQVEVMYIHSKRTDSVRAC